MCLFIVNDSLNLWEKIGNKHCEREIPKPLDFSEVHPVLELAMDAIRKKMQSMKVKKFTFKTKFNLQIPG